MSNCYSSATTMSTRTFSPVNRRFSILEELEHAVACLHAGLQRIAEGGTILRVDSPTLFLLSIGLERYLKVAIHILHHQRSGDFANFATMKRHGHELSSLELAVLGLEDASVRTRPIARDDLDFAKNDPLLRKLLDCLNAFACGERYFVLDGAAGKPMDPDNSPRARWEDILELAAGGDDDLSLDAQRAKQVVASRLICCMQRYLRCISQAVCYSTTNLSRSLASGMEIFLGLKNDALNVLVEQR